MEPNYRKADSIKLRDFQSPPTFELQINAIIPALPKESGKDSAQQASDVLEINLGNQPSLSHRSIDSRLFLKETPPEEARTKINKVPDLFSSKNRQPNSRRSSASAGNSKASSKLPEVEISRSVDIEEAPPTERADITRLAPFVPVYVLEGLEEQAGIDSIDENDLSAKLRLLRKETHNQEGQKNKLKNMIEELKQEKLELNVKISRVQRDHMEHKQILLGDIELLKEKLQELSNNVRELQDLDELNKQIANKENSILRKRETILELRSKIQQTNSEYLNIKLKEKKTLEEASKAEDQMKILLNELNAFERKQAQERSHQDNELSKLQKQLEFYKTQIVLSIQPLLTAQKDQLEKENTSLAQLLKTKQRGKYSEAISQKEAELQETRKALHEAEASNRLKVDEFERLLQSFSPIKPIVDFK